MTPNAAIQAEADNLLDALGDLMQDVDLSIVVAVLLTGLRQCARLIEAHDEAAAREFATARMATDLREMADELESAHAPKH